MKGENWLVVGADPRLATCCAMPLFAEGKDEVFVGRIRKDPNHAGGFHMWIVSDNLLKGRH